MGLTTDDFEVFEDGVRQHIIRLESIDGAVASIRSPSTGSMLPLLNGDGMQGLVALLFDQLTPQSRKAAIDAARSMLTSIRDDEFMGVFSMDLHSTVHAPFTRDRGVLLRALDEVLRAPNLAPIGTTVATGIAETDGPSAHPATPDARLAAEMRERLEAPTERAYYAGAQAASLSDVINRLARFPGRKAVILFSEGLFGTPRLEAVVAQALAENVTIYTVNASGLATGRPVVASDRSVDSRELTSTSQRGRESWRYGFLEMDATGALGPLASHTGGFLVANTNDLLDALGSISNDRRSYHVIGYSSSNQNLDGTTRRIEVRVKRPELSVRARTSYVATMPAVENPSTEERALAALAREPRPRDFEIALRAYRTPKPTQPYLMSVLVEVPASKVTYKENSTSKKYAGELSIYTQLSSASEIVAAHNQRYELTGDLPRLTAFKQRSLAYFRTVTVPPGAYRLDVVVEDVISAQTSTSALEVVSAPASAMVVGDLVLVQEMRRVSEKQAEAHPFGSARSIITPNVTGILERNERDQMLFAVPIVARGRVSGQLSSCGPHATVIPVELGLPIKLGGFVVLPAMPLASVPGREFDVCPTMNVDGQRVERRHHVVLVP